MGRMLLSLLPTLSLTLSQTWERGLTPYVDYSFPSSLNS